MPRIPISLLIVLLAAGNADAAPPAANPRSTETRGAIVEFSLDVSRTLSSDLSRATAVADSSDADAEALAKRVNASLAAALATARAYPAVKVQAGNSNTQAIYGKTGRSVEGWRMRAELLLESRDAAQLSELLGKLQATLAVSRIDQQISPQAKRKFEEELSLEALAAFGDRAKKIAAALQKPYRIKQMQLREWRPPATTSATAKAGNETAAGGEMQQGISVSGQIELLE